MKKIIIFISLFIGIYFNINAQSIAANQLNGRLSIQTATNVSDSTWAISGYFAHSTGKFTTNQVAVNDKFFIQIGANTYVGRISVVNSVAVNLITFRVICNYPNPPNGVGAIIRSTSNGYPVYVDGIANNLQAGIQNYFATLINTNAVGNFCEQTLTKTAHGFRKFTPIYWNGSTYIRPTADILVPDFVVVDSLTANTFKVANCGTYTTSLTNGLYWFTSASPGYSLTADTTKVPLFQALNGKLILNPIVGFNLMSGTASSSALADTAAAIRSSIPVTDTLYILGIGQSNMIGRPDTSVTHGAVAWDSTGNEKVLVFNLENNTWQVATESNCHGIWGDLYGTVSANNAVWQFAKELQRRTKAVVKYVISARGGRALSYWTGNTYPMTGEGWDSLRNAVNYSRVQKFDAFIWCQGESDINNANYEYYFKNQFLKTIRSQTWFSNWTPIILTGMPVVNTVYRPFNERLEVFAENSDPYINIAHTDSLALTTNDPFSPGNDVHYTGLSLDKLGARYYNALINTPKNYKRSGIYDLRNRDIFINGNGNELRLDSIAGRIKVDKNQSFYIEKSEPGWVGRFEPYQYLEYTNNGDPRFEFRSFLGDNFDTPGNITQNSGFPRLGGFHFRGYQGGSWRRGASMVAYPDSVATNYVAGMIRFNVGSNLNGFNVGESLMSMSSRGLVMGGGIIRPDADAAWQVDQTNVNTYYWNGPSRIYSKFKNTILAVQSGTQPYSFYHNPAINRTRILGTIYRNSSDNVGWFTGTGSPEGAITASIGSLYTRTDGSGLTAIYFKETGSSNTGWVPKIGTDQVGLSQLATNAVDSTKAANLSPNDLAQTGASAGQVLTWTGSKYAPRTVSIGGSATLNFGSTTAGAVNDQNITVIDAALGDVVSLGVPNASQTTTGSFFAWVSATNTVTVRFIPGVLVGSEDPASGTFKVTVTK